MEVSTMFSDDQLAVMGCFFALAACGFIAAMSFQFGPKGRQQRQLESVRSRTLSVEKAQEQMAQPGRRAA